MATQGKQVNTAVFALLYHPTECADAIQHQLLHGCFASIQRDHVLAKMIHITPMNSPDARNWAMHNSSGVTVAKFPCFVIRLNKGKPRVYTLEMHNTVFNLAHVHHNNFMSMTSPKLDTNPVTGNGNVVPVSGSEDDILNNIVPAVVPTYLEDVSTSPDDTNLEDTCLPTDTPVLVEVVRVEEDSSSSDRKCVKPVKAISFKKKKQHKRRESKGEDIDLTKLADDIRSTI